MDNRSNTGFGARLSALRLQRQLTQPALDFALDLAPGTVQRWERDVESPKAMHLVKLAQQLDCSIDDLLLGPATHGETSSAVHTAELDRFLRTADGKRANEAGLVQMLSILPSSYTVERYRRIVEAMLQPGSLKKLD